MCYSADMESPPALPEHIAALAAKHASLSSNRQAAEDELIAAVKAAETPINYSALVEAARMSRTTLYRRLA